MERVKKLRGGACPEKATYVRLHLLSAVALYHQGNAAAASRLLDEARRECDALCVTSEEVAAVASMGFEPADAHAALLACGKDVGRAIEWIIAERERRDRERSAEAVRQHARRRVLKYGKTTAGSLVDAALLAQLVEMGFDEPVAAEALRRHGNDHLRTIESLSSAEERAAISAACAAAAHTRRPKKPRGALRPLPTGSGEAEPSAAAARLSELGFEAAAIEVALHAADGDVDRAAEILMLEAQHQMQHVRCVAWHATYRLRRRLDRTHRTHRGKGTG